MTEELKQIKGVVLRLLGALVALVAVLFAVPMVAGQSVAVWVIGRVRLDLVPADVALIITNPLDAFLSQAIVAVLLALFLLAPLVAFELWRFVAPGLYHAERRSLALFVLCALVLWYGGAAFAYAVLIPATYSALYGFLPAGVAPLFSLRELVSLTAGLTLVSGATFLLPVAMVLLTRMRLVPAHFWRSHARYAVLIVLVASAIITPDGSGVSMVLLSLPVGALYAAGYGGAVLSTKYT